MTAHVLMVDDQIDLLKPLGRMLGQEGYRVSLVSDGQEALLKAAQDHPDLVVVDVNMPGMDGFEVVRRLRSLRSTALVPILFLSGHGDAPDKVKGLRLGADDYLTKPVDLEEFKARIESALGRTKRSMDSNPLTGLPGNSAIETVITRRIWEGKRFALAYVDIDFFKSFNDAYGFAKGDVMIKALGQILVDAVNKMGFPEDFVGHIGGDDFVLVTYPESLDAVVSHAMDVFDGFVPEFYNEEDRRRGGIFIKNRQNQWESFPVARLSIGATSTEKRRFTSYGQVAGIASEMKKHAKSIKRPASFCAKDQRTA